jgi:hypothetical protein
MGLQRGGVLLVRLFHDGGVRPEDCVLRLAYANGKFGTVQPIAEPSRNRELDGVEAQLRAHRRGAGLGAHHIDFAFAPKETQLVRTAVVKVRRGDRLELAPWAKGFSFAYRIPRNQQEFKDHLTFKKRRHSDDETVLAASVDALRAYLDGPEAQSLAPYLVNAFVISMYKAVTINARRNPAVAYEPKIQALIDGLAPSPSMRHDAEHARLSVHTAMWHYAVHIGDRATFDAAMAGVEAVSRIEREQHPGFAFNACKSLLLHGLLTSFDDLRRARRIFALVYERFREAAAVRTSNATKLQELAVALEASILAVSASAFLGAGTELSIGNVRSIIALAPRIETPRFTKKLKAMVAERRASGTAKLKPAPSRKATAVVSDDGGDEDHEG